MIYSPRSETLLRGVAARIRLAALGNRFYVLLLILSAVYAIVLLICRLAGLSPPWLRPWTLLCLPAIALVISLFWHRRPTAADAARRVDRHGGTKDLFLTLAMLERSAGQYQSLVMREAEANAPHIRPREVVALHCVRPLVQLTGVALLLWVGVLYFPLLDPFGRVAAAQEQTDVREQLRRDRTANQLRLRELEQSAENAKKSQQVTQAIDELASSLRKMKPVEKNDNLKTLERSQRTIGRKWREISAKELKTLLEQSSSRQDFGGANKEKLNQWTRELQQGVDEALQREIAGLRDDLKALMETKDPVKRAEKTRQLRRQLRDLEDFASRRLNSPQLKAALKRALSQLEASNMEGMSSEAMEALRESLELVQLELEQIAQSARDLKSLEDALKIVQMAKQLNDRERLDGEACSDCQSLGDYAELFALMMDDQQQGGGGMRGPGFGEGGEAPEDDSVETAYQAERSKSAVTAGKILLTLKSKGMSDRGDARKDYRALINQVKQGVSEAIQVEQIPAGYHDGIRNYFDTMDSPVDQTVAGQE